MRVCMYTRICVFKKVSHKGKHYYRHPAASTLWLPAAELNTSTQPQSKSLTLLTKAFHAQRRWVVGAGTAGVKE